MNYVFLTRNSKFSLSDGFALSENFLVGGNMINFRGLAAGIAIGIAMSDIAFGIAIGVALAFIWNDDD